MRRLTENDILVHVGRSEGIGVIRIDTEYSQDSRPMLFKEAEELRKQILVDQKLRELLEKEVHDCDCEYGGCRHSMAEQLLKESKK